MSFSFTPARLWIASLIVAGAMVVLPASAHADNPRSDMMKSSEMMMAAMEDMMKMHQMMMDACGQMSGSMPMMMKAHTAMMRAMRIMSDHK